jgi:hypothetical protein
MDQVNKTIKAWRIDAITGEVTPFEYPDGEKKVRERLDKFYTALSMDGLRPCDDINSVRIDDDGHYLYVDGEGLLKDPTHFILWKGYHQALAGHALVIRINRMDGDGRDVKVTKDWVEKRVKLAKLKMLGFVKRVERREIFGQPGTAHINIPVFVPRKSDKEPLTMAAIAEHLGFPGEKLEWTVLPSEDDLADYLAEQGAKDDDTETGTIH